MSIPGSASPLLLASTAAAGGYQVSRSLRFNAPDTAFLNRTPAVAGNRKTWTWAGWVKRCQFGTYEHIFNGTGSSPSYAQFYWSPTEQLVFDNGGSGAITTTQVFRDPSAWYHIVLTFDTTQGTAADRMRMYANGQQITTFSSSSYPTQNSDGGMNQASAHFIGKDSSFAGFYLADIHFIDGQALTPSSFTEVSATTGQLVPIAYTGTYGTNGFQLKFADNSSNTATTLGKDTSPNGNNWTPNNFSVVAAGGGASTVTTPASNAPPTVDYLVVGGGGSGGGPNAGNSGGGGAGGVRSTVTATGGGGTLETPLSLSSSTSYTVTIGAGGATQSGDAVGNNGSNSVFSTVIAIGGGGGGKLVSIPGNAGGSGGGAGQGTSSGGAGTANQGYNGGSHSGGYSGAGGGGAGALGANDSGANPGNGGAGVYISITGSSVAYGGGGGGSAHSSATVNAAGGVGGGGAGKTAANVAAVAGTANTGGGGGGGGENSSSGAAGGSGIVILRYANTYDDLTVGSGLIYTYANIGGYKIYSFTGSATPAQAAGNDSLVDTPTSYGTPDTGVGGEVRGNYATFNPLDNGGLTLSNGNLDITEGLSASMNCKSTIGISSGKYYWELTNNSLDYYSQSGTNTNSRAGISTKESSITSVLGSLSTQYIYEYAGVTGSGTTGKIINNNIESTFGLVIQKGDVLNFACDFDSGKIWYGKNGTFFNSGNPATGANASQTFTPGGNTWLPTVMQRGTGGTNATLNFGARSFAYTAPSGFKALCDTNLPAPVVAKPSTVFDVITYTGTGSSLTLPNGSSTPTSISFTPDFAWLKGRSGATDHALYDAVRDVQKDLVSNSTSAETTETTGLTAFGTNTFTVGSLAKLNTSSSTYVAWAWNAGGTTASNPDGSITSQVRANPTAGFSVVTYTGNGTGGATIGHGLGAAPKLVIFKCRDYTYAWLTYHGSLPNTSILALDSTAAAAPGFPTFLNSTDPSSTVVTLGSTVGVNESSRTYVAYCFAPVIGFSSFGSYVGNGSSDGPMVYTGFRPRWVLVKLSSAAGNPWLIFDSARSTYNVVGNKLAPNSSVAEDDASIGNNTQNTVDFLSNGFKPRTADNGTNGSSQTYIYYAVAENPFQYARAR